MPPGWVELDGGVGSLGYRSSFAGLGQMGSSIFTVVGFGRWRNAKFCVLLLNDPKYASDDGMPPFDAGKIRLKGRGC